MLGSAIDVMGAGNAALKAQQSTRSRRMAYVHGTVSIYGLLEETVGNLIMEVASEYPQIYSNYSSLPDAVRHSHREYSLRTLLEGDRVRLRDPINENVNLSILAANYNNLPLQLNSAAFTYTTANYRHAHIADLMRRLDIDIQGLPATDPVQEALTNSGLEFRDAEALILDLVDRRNQIVHSYQTAELLEFSVLAAYLDVIQAYLTQLFHMTSDHLLWVVSEKKLTSIGVAAKRWTHSVGVEMTNGQIQAPCTIMLIKERRVLLRGTQSIQSKGTPIHGKVETSGEPIELGISIDSPLPASVIGAKVFVLPDRWLHLAV
jgi:RiboL-PSP-HEPN